MKARENIGVIFFIFLLLSVLIFFLSRIGFLNKPASVLYSTTSVFSKISYNLLSNFPFFGNDTKIKNLEDQNISLTKKLVDQERLLAENKSLHDQFQTVSPKSLDLLPANIVGAPRFFPGISTPDTYIIDVGSKDGVKVGSAVVSKDNLVGRVTKTTEFLSEVTLVTNISSKFAANVVGSLPAGRQVLGVEKGQGNGDIILDNVLLSETLNKGDFVLSGGDLALELSGFPSGLIVGKITSVDKNPSNLFQKAKVESLVNFSSLSEVFVVVGLSAQAGIK